MEWSDQLPPWVGHNQIAIGVFLATLVIWLIYAQASIGRLTSRLGDFSELQIEREKRKT